MKQTKLFFLFASLLLFGVFVSSSALASPINTTNYSTNLNAGGVQVSTIKYTPYPANPGEYFDVWVQATLGSGVNYAKFAIENTFPFSVDNGSDGSQVYTDMASRDVVMHFKVRVSEDAVSGMNNLKLAIYTSPVSTSALVDNLGIYVTDAQTNFATVVQDESSGSVSLAIANIGENTANSMIVKIPNQESFRVSGTNGQMVGNLNAGDYSIVNFNVLPNGRSYGVEGNNLTIEIDYTDAIGVRRTVFQNVTYSPSLGNSTVAFTGGTGTSGFTRGTFQRAGSSGGTNWIAIIIVVVLIVALFLFYKLKPERFKKIFERKSANKSEKEVSQVPSWIVKEKAKEKNSREK